MKRTVLAAVFAVIGLSVLAQDLSENEGLNGVVWQQMDEAMRVSAIAGIFELLDVLRFAGGMVDSDRAEGMYHIQATVSDVTSLVTEFYEDERNRHINLGIAVLIVTRKLPLWFPQGGSR